MSNHVLIPYERGTFDAFVSIPDEKPRGGVVLIHEIWGLNDHIEDIGKRLCSEGFAVVAPALLKTSGILEHLGPELQHELYDPHTRMQAQATLREAMRPMRTVQFAEDTLGKLKACADYLLAGIVEKIAVIGFCFGGTYAFHLACHDPRLAGTVVFYGHPPDLLDKLRAIRAPVLAFYGANDLPLVGSLPVLTDAAKQYRVDFSYVVYPGAAHAFFNDQNPKAYNADAARDSWERTLEFLNARFN